MNHRHFRAQVFSPKDFPCPHPHCPEYLGPNWYVPIFTKFDAIACLAPEQVAVPSRIERRHYQSNHFKLTPFLSPDELVDCWTWTLVPETTKGESE